MGVGLRVGLLVGSLKATGAFVGLRVGRFVGSSVGFLVPCVGRGVGRSCFRAWQGKSFRCRAARSLLAACCRWVGYEPDSRSATDVRLGPTAARAFRGVPVKPVLLPGRRGTV